MRVLSIKVLIRKKGNLSNDPRICINMFTYIIMCIYITINVCIYVYV